ncbi:7075_t:CDS:1, partial [Dentiscutata erythropus]
ILKRKKDKKSILKNSKKEKNVKIRLAEINLNESKIDILQENITTNAKKKATLLYTKYKHVNYSTEIVKE